MSKSKDNYIPIFASPADMYGKVMSIPDEVMWIWFRELTELSPQQREELFRSVANGDLHPKKAKQLLARAVVYRFQGCNLGIVNNAEQDFEAKFGTSGDNTNITPKIFEIAQDATFLDSLSIATGRSKTEVRRLFANNAIRIGDTTAWNPLPPQALSESAWTFCDKIIKVGKTAFIMFKGKS